MTSTNSTFLALVVVQLACCAFMAGVIWVVQLILYPAFAQIQSAEFSAFHAKHSQKITFIVGPMMGLELFTAAGLVYLSQESFFFTKGLGHIGMQGKR